MADAFRNKTLNALSKVLSGEAFLADALQEEELPPFYARLLRGTTERYVTLTAFLKELSRTKTEKLRPLFRNALLMGLYEIFYMDTPDYAAVHETVELVRKRGFNNLTGLANGILRSGAREKEKLIAGLRKSEEIGLPELIFRIFVKNYGMENTMTMGRYFLSEEGKGLTVRRIASNCTKEALQESLGEDGAEIKEFFPVPGCALSSDRFFLLSAEQKVEELKAFRKGCFYVQDAAPFLGYLEACSRLKLSDEGKEVAFLDLSAAPGGKTLQVCDFLREKQVSFRGIACDLTEKKLLRIRENTERLGFSGIETMQNDACVRRPRWEERFDLVIADVPCSGLGVLSGKPDIKLHVSEESLRELTEIQGKILENAGAYLKKGGFLFYSTCTLNPEENENMIGRFTEKHVEFRTVFEKTYLPGINVNGDGFYICVLEKA